MAVKANKKNQVGKQDGIYVKFGFQFPNEIVLSAGHAPGSVLCHTQ